MNTEKDIINLLANQLKQLKYPYQIADFFEKENVPYESRNEILALAKKQYRSEGSLKRRMIWIALFILSFVFFMFLFPIYSYAKHPVLYSIFGCLITGFFLTQSILNYRHFEEVKIGSKNSDWRDKALPAAIFPIALLFVIFLYNTSGRKERELQKYGELTQGIIIGGEGVKLRRGGSYDVSIKFLTNDNREIAGSASVSEQQFNSLRTGEKLVVVYSKKDPAFFEPIISEQQKSAYLIRSKWLNPVELVKIFKCPKQKRLAQLNAISAIWEYDAKNELWHNWISNAGISIKGNKLSFLTTSENDILQLRLKQIDFIDELKALGFKRNDTKEEVMSFTKSGFLFQIKIIDGVSLIELSKT